MEHEKTIDALKKQLLNRVADLYQRDRRVWKQPIVATLRDLQTANVRAVFFGGTLRSLLVARATDWKLGRPRDIDIVVSGIPIDDLKGQFEKIILRETRFGGLKLRRFEWQFDVWPLQRTWAFSQDPVAVPEFDALPSTTFFNLEAIAVEVWAQPGRSRKIFSGDDQFFKGILTRTLEINREENPFPKLCVLRALVISANHDFKIGPRLARYVAQHGTAMTPDELDELQRKHYGRRQIDGRALRSWIELTAEAHAHDASAPIRLPVTRQLELWSEPEEATCLRVHALSE